MREELKPCPFCGGQPYHDETDEGGHFIACSKCGGGTNLRFAHGDDPYPLLAEQWNRRALLSDDLEALRRDAMRYRWLRDFDNGGALSVGKSYEFGDCGWERVEWLYENELDAIIDAAMAQEVGK